MRKLFPDNNKQVSEKELSKNDFIEFGTLEIILARAKGYNLCQFVAGKIIKCEETFSKTFKDLEERDYVLKWERYGSTLETVDLPHATRFRLNIIRRNGRQVYTYRPNILQPSL